MRRSDERARWARGAGAAGTRRFGAPPPSGPNRGCRSAPALTALLTLAAPALGCIDTDPAVFVDASIVAPTATVAQQTLVTTLAGGFTLSLHLGPRASGDAQAGLGAVSLTNAAQTATLVDVVQVTTSQPFPVTVPVDGDVDVAVVFGEQDNLLEQDAYDTICTAGSLSLVAALDDSLRGGLVTVASAPFVPAGCP